MNTQPRVAELDWSPKNVGLPPLRTRRSVSLRHVAAPVVPTAGRIAGSIVSRVLHGVS